MATDQDRANALVQRLKGRAGAPKPPDGPVPVTSGPSEVIDRDHSSPKVRAMMRADQGTDIRHAQGNPANEPIGLNEGTGGVGRGRRIREGLALRREQQAHDYSWAGVTAATGHQAPPVDPITNQNYLSHRGGKTPGSPYKHGVKPIPEGQDRRRLLRLHANERRRMGNAEQYSRGAYAGEVRSGRPMNQHVADRYAAEANRVRDLRNQGFVMRVSRPPGKPPMFSNR